MPMAPGHFKRQDLGCLAAQAGELDATICFFKAAAFGHPGFVSASGAFGLQGGDAFHRSVELENGSDPQDPEDLWGSHLRRSQGVWCPDATYKLLRMFILTGDAMCRPRLNPLA